MKYKQPQSSEERIKALRAASKRNMKRIVKKCMPLKYKVVGYDSFSREEFSVGNFSSTDKAIQCADKHSGSMTLMYVYDTITGHRIYKSGTF